MDSVPSPCNRRHICHASLPESYRRALNGQVKRFISQVVDFIEVSYNIAYRNPYKRLSETGIPRYLQSLSIVYKGK